MKSDVALYHSSHLQTSSYKNLKDLQYMYPCHLDDVNATVFEITAQMKRNLP